MKGIVQEHPMGCGLACVAFVTRQPYGSILKLTNEVKASTKGYYCKELTSFLRKFGLNYNYKKFTEKTKKYLTKEGTIVFVKMSKKYPEGHYLVNTKRGWMNPWINYPRIIPAKSGFNKELPGQAQWILFNVGEN